MRLVIRTRPSRPVTLVLAAMLASLLIAGTSGCALLGGSSSPTTVTDPGGFFHFKIPGDWQHNVADDLIAVYAADELPEAGNGIDSLSILVFSASTDDTSTPVADKVANVVDLRAEARGWQEYDVQDAEEITVGGRPGTRVQVTGVDSEGVPFEGAYHLVRTAGREVLIVAVSPAGSWESDRKQLDEVFEQWFWLRTDS
jgi:hypothetical protein